MSVKARSSFPILTTQGPRGCRFSQRLKTELPRYGRVFKKRFPDAKGIGEIYFMPNLLGGWDAGSGNPDGHPMLVFAVDSIVKLKKEGFNLATLISSRIVSSVP